jgi:hypothetical protein
MTYQQLLNTLSKLNKEQLDCDVTIYDCKSDEFYQYDGNLYVYYGNGVLDHNHPFIPIPNLDLGLSLSNGNNIEDHGHPFGFLEQVKKNTGIVI